MPIFPGMNDKDTRYLYGIENIPGQKIHSKSPDTKTPHWTRTPEIAIPKFVRDILISELHGVARVPD